MSTRPTARVLLVDPEGRLLLMRFTGDTGVVFWAPCGGGVEPGESFEQAAVREVAEETGLADVALGPHVFDRTDDFTWRGRRYRTVERWFLARVPAFAPSRAGWTAAERAEVDDLRWWTAAELAATADTLVPRDLAHRYAALLADGPPRGADHHRRLTTCPCPRSPGRPSARTAHSPRPRSAAPRGERCRGERRAQLSAYPATASSGPCSRRPWAVSR